MKGSKMRNLQHEKKRHGNRKKGFYRRLENIISRGILTAILFAATFFSSCVNGPAGCTETADSTGIKTMFAKPPLEYSSGPLWVWNDMLTDEQIVSTMRDLARQNVKSVFVHPRPGLMTPYLSDEWFRLWEVALKEAERLDMNVWIYDENSYPSGFAGGWVPELMPESRGRGLVIQEEKQPPKSSDNIIGVYRIEPDGFKNVTQQVQSAEKIPQAGYLVARVERAKKSPWHADRWYVDLTYPGVTEKFLEVTLEPYRKRFGNEFGKRIPGVFTDEPHLMPAGRLHWTNDLPQVFEKRWGYSLLDNLPSLVRPVGDWRRIRHNYYQVLLDLFIERWAKVCYNYCERYGLEFTGHYWEHGWPLCVTAPDNMAMYAWHHRPAIDNLFNQYREDTHAQFGNVRAVKELSSVANQLGRRRTLCEAYGGGGWDLRFEDMKRIGDWLYVLGVNTLNEHLSHISIRGARKADYPQSFSYHEPWWNGYHIIADYFTRLSLALSQGREVNRILVIEPTTTAWMYQAHPDRLKAIGDEFQQMVVELSKAQIEYDLGCEDIINLHGCIEKKIFTVGKRQYDTVVLGPLTENLNTKTMDLLEGYLKNGGTVFCCGSAPERIDGSLSNRGTIASQKPGWRQIKPEDVVPVLRDRSSDNFVIRQNSNDKGILYHHRRKLDDGELLFITNTSIDSPCSGVIESAAKGVEQWDAETGKIRPYPFKTSKKGINAKFELPPCGSLLLFLSNDKRKPLITDSPKVSTIQPAGPPNIRRLDLNVLTLDYVDVTTGGQTKENIYYSHASQFVFEKNGMKHNPWDHAVQFRDEIISRKFPSDSGFEATYRFTIEEKVPEPVYIVIERPDLYTITCNGKSIRAEQGSWWLDRSFGKIDITSVVRLGDNEVTIKASPFTVYHELSAAYVLGDFSLKPAKSGFTIVPEATLKPGKWNKQGLPLYAAGLAYSQSFEISNPNGQYHIELKDWYGSVAKVIVNGKSAGYIGYRPWKSDVTDLIRPGKNNIEVAVIGTLKNTLGPHHKNPPLGFAGPGSFRKAPEQGPPPGNKYHTIGYGLFEPFELKVTSQTQQ